MPEPADDRDTDLVALLTKHQQAIRLYVTALMAGSPDSADVAQQANTTIWKKRADFVPGTNFKAWAFAVARYEVLNHRRRVARESRWVFSDSIEEDFASELPEFGDGLERRQEALRDCLARLRPAQRELIRHRYTLGTPLKEYAEQVGRSAAGLKVTLHRLRTALGQCIERKLRTSP